jgi:hypothetical protein
MLRAEDQFRVELVSRKAQPGLGGIWSGPAGAAGQPESAAPPAGGENA